MGQERRTRAKAARAAAEAARKRQLEQRRRKRIIGLIASLAALAVIAVFAIALAGGDDGGDRARSDDRNEAGSDKETEAGGKLPKGCRQRKAPENDAGQYDSPPDNTLKKRVDYWATIKTSCGTIEIDLLEDEASETVNNFVFLAEEGYYDGLIWHRVVNDFVVQGGDPEGTGAGGPGYEFPDELPEQSNVYTFGAVAMANSGPDTNGSQFFIVSHDAKTAQGGEPQPASLQPLYSYFGEATEDSYEVIDRIQKARVDESDKPVTPVYMLDVEIEER